MTIENNRFFPAKIIPRVIQHVCIENNLIPNYHFIFTEEQIVGLSTRIDPISMNVERLKYQYIECHVS